MTCIMALMQSHSMFAASVQAACLAAQAEALMESMRLAREAGGPG